MAAETELVAIKIESCKGATPIDSTSADRLSNQKRRCLNKNKSRINCGSEIFSEIWDDNYAGGEMKRR